MGTYLYLLSAEAKKVKTETGRVEINLLKFLCKPHYRDELPGLVKARMTKNENYWRDRPKPKLAAYRVENKDTVVHWDPDHATCFGDDRLFMPAAGEIEDTIFGLRFRPYLTLRGTTEIGWQEMHEKLSFLREHAPGIFTQTSSRSSVGGPITEFFLHAKTPAQQVMAKLHFPEAQPFSGF